MALRDARSMGYAYLSAPRPTPDEMRAKGEAQAAAAREAAEEGRREAAAAKMREG